MNIIVILQRENKRKNGSKVHDTLQSHIKGTGRSVDLKINKSSPLSLDQDLTHLMFGPPHSTISLFTLWIETRRATGGLKYWRANI